MNSPTINVAMPLTPAGSHRWTTFAGPEWSNPGGGLWGGYAIGLAIRVLDAEPTAAGEALSLTLTYAAALPSGAIEVRTRCLRQGRSIGVWEVEILPGGSGQVGVHAIVTMAQRPATPPFAFAKMPAVPAPETLPKLEFDAPSQHYGASAFERRMLGDFMPEAGGTSGLSHAWVRPRRGRSTRRCSGW